MLAENTSDILTGSIGILGTSGGLILSHIDQIETALRITSLIIGIAVGMATLYSLIRRKR